MFSAQFYCEHLPWDSIDHYNFSKYFKIKTSDIPRRTSVNKNETKRKKKKTKFVLDSIKDAFCDTPEDRCYDNAYRRGRITMRNCERYCGYGTHRHDYEKYRRVGKSATNPIIVLYEQNSNTSFSISQYF